MAKKKATKKSAARKAPARKVAASTKKKPSQSAKTAKKKPAQKAATSKGAAKKKPAAKKAAVKKAAAKKAATSKGAAKKAAKKKPAAKKAAAKKVAAKKVGAKKAVAKKPAVRKKTAKQAAVKKPVTKKSAAGKTPAPAAKQTQPAASKTRTTKAATKKAATSARPTKTSAAKTRVSTPGVSKQAPAKKAATVASRAPAVDAAQAPDTVVEGSDAVTSVPASTGNGSASGASVAETAKSRVKKDDMEGTDSDSPNKPARRRATAGRSGVAVATARAASGAAKSTSKSRPKAITLEDLDKVELGPDYRPHDDDDYMNIRHLAYFKRKLDQWRDELIAESQETLEHLRSESRDVGDEAERASRESDNILELRTRDRYRKLLRKIDQAVERILDGSYGYCEETGEEIGVARLEARPIATLTVDAQERREMLQKQFRDDH